MNPNLVRSGNIKVFSQNNVYWIEPKRSKWLYFYDGLSTRGINITELFKFIDTEDFLYMVYLYCYWDKKE